MTKIAQFLSNLFQPLLIPTYSMMLLFQVGKFAYLDITLKVFIVSSIFILTSIVPLAVIFVLKKMGVVSSIQLTERKERTVPYVFVVLSYIAAIFFLYRISMPNYIVSMMTGVVVSTVLIMFINFKWKISAHLSAVGGLCAAIIVVAFRMEINASVVLSIAILLSGLLATARIVLKVHTLMQTICGFLAGFLILLLFGFLF